MDDSEFDGEAVSVEFGGDGSLPGPTPIGPIRIVAGYGILAAGFTVVIGTLLAFIWWGYNYGLYLSSGSQMTLADAVVVTVLGSMLYLAFLGYLVVTCVRELLAMRRRARAGSS